jgi:predicted lipid-binding transport protein (Tim44 family)
MQDSFDLTTIIFALLAAFVVWKLRGVLGTRNGAEKPPNNPFLKRTPEAARARPGDAKSNVIALHGAAEGPIGASEKIPADPVERWKTYAEPGSKAWAGLDAIAATDRSFAIQPFLDGAKAAYEMIVTAFAAGNRGVLQNLLAGPVFDSFAAALTEREKRGEKIETTFVAIDKAVIEDAEMRGGFADITLRFAAQMITATRDQTGAVIEGSADKVIEITDVWTFAREVGSPDPNWKVISTGAAR